MVFSLAVRDVATLDNATFIPGGLPDNILKAIAGESRTAKSELDFIIAQMQRRGARPGRIRAGRSVRPARSGARRNCSKGSLPCRMSAGYRC